MLDPLAAWISAFAFTQAVEVPIYVYGQSLDGREGARASILRRAAVGFGASALTHPIVWFVIPTIVPWSYWTMVVCAEVFAVTAEAGYFHLFGLKRAFWWSLLANASSAGLGLACRYAFGWP